MLAQKMALSLPTIKRLGWENKYSLEFEGNPNRVDCGDADIFSFEESGQDQPFSFSVWVYFTAAPIDMGFISKDDSGTSEYIISVDGTGRLFFRLFDGNTTTNYIQVETDNPVGLPVGWHHYVVTYDGSEAEEGLTIYINGLQPTQTQSTTGSYSHGMTNTTASLKFGVWGRLRYYLEAYMDEVSLWNEELTAGAVWTLYNAGTPTDLTGMATLIGWWRCGDTAGPSVYPNIQDYSVEGNDGEMLGMNSGLITTEVP